MYDVAIIGSGPSGLTAALYTSRAFLKTVIFTGIQPGGQLTTTTEVDNFPGFPNGIMGPKLMKDMEDQVKRFGSEVFFESVTKIEKNNNFFNLITDNNAIKSKTVIITTGASAMYLGLESEKRLSGKGVSACATCDGFFFKGKTIAVAGGGDTAMEEANFLTTFASKVYLVHRRDEFRASAIMLEKARKNPKIEFILNKTILEVLGENSVSGLKIKDNKTNDISTLNVQGLFLAIGHKPNTNFLKGLINMDEKGYIILTTPQSTMSYHTKTNVDGIFAAGDCVDPRYRQAIIAAGMGCQAALDAQKYLE